MTQYLISKDLRDYMKHHDKSILKVHSIFEEAMNLIGEDDTLITLLSPSKGISPMSAIYPLSDFMLQKSSQGDAVEIMGTMLSFLKTGIEIDFSHHDLWNPDIQKRTKVLTDEKLQGQVNELREIIIDYGRLEGIVALIETLDFKLETAGFEPSDEISSQADEPINQYADFIEDRVVGLLNAFYLRDKSQIMKCIPKFVGFGPGLTPSTDDFLLGLIISMIYESKVKGNQMKTVLGNASCICGEAVGKTTKVSEAMLLQGAAGKVADSYRAAVQALFYDVKPPLERLCTKVLENGSTSGTDFLFGVYCYGMLRLKWNKEGGI